MKIAKHWFKASTQATVPGGQRWTVDRWGWSDASAADAKAVAEQAAQDLARRVAASGRWPDSYQYGLEGRPLREEIITEQRDAEGRLLLAITRNSYGALVLNAAEAVFIDIDGAEADEPAAGSGGGFLGSLFGRKPAAPPPAPAEPPEMQRVRGWAQSHPDWSLRVYRTRAGLRVLVTHAPMAPDSPAVQNAMRELQADPLYIRLCRAQQCFRARLTPKPWRIAVAERPPKFPYRAQDAAPLARWKAGYERSAAAYATCSLLAELGPQTVHPSLAATIALHDHACKVTDRLPLA
jgi:hypothetical protein